MGTMTNDRICHECGTTALPTDRYCAECGQPLVEPASTWPQPVDETEGGTADPVFVPLDLPPDTGADVPPKGGWIGNLLRSRSA